METLQSNFHHLQKLFHQVLVNELYPLFIAKHLSYWNYVWIKFHYLTLALT